MKNMVCITYKPFFLLNPYSIIQQSHTWLDKVVYINFLNKEAVKHTYNLSMVEVGTTHYFHGPVTRTTLPLQPAVKAPFFPDPAKKKVFFH
jgi:hypothetical protein